MQIKNIRDRFIGTWRLIHCIEKKPDGSIFHNWGEGAIGYIIYTKENRVSVQIMRVNRKAYGTMNIQDITPDESFALSRDYNAYFGSFKIDLDKQLIIHHIEGHLVPNFIGKENKRKFEFKDNKLLLITVDNDISRELLWEKL